MATQLRRDLPLLLRRIPLLHSRNLTRRLELARRLSSALPLSHPRLMITNM